MSFLPSLELERSSAIIGSDSENDLGKCNTIEMVDYGDAVPISSTKSDDEIEDNLLLNLPDTVTLLNFEKTGAKVYLVGTAHFSKESQDDVEKVIRSVKPHIVVVELCQSRTSILALDEKTVLEEAKKIDMTKIMATIKSNGLINGLMYILLLNMSAHITKEIGMAPGGEFRVAYREATKIPNCCVHLGDRPIGITMRRALSRLSWFQTMKLAWHLLTAKDPISIDDIEKCKDRDMLEQLLADLAGEYPAFREVFLDERDIYLTNSLQSAAAVRPHIKPGEIQDESLRIVGVVGIGHTPGIIRLWPMEQRQLIPNIMTVPPPSMTSKIIKHTIRISLLGFGGFLIYRLLPIPEVVMSSIGVCLRKNILDIKISSVAKSSLN